MERCVRRYGIESVVEVGAGETSILFHRNGCRVISIEWQEGPWVDRARPASDVHIVSFDPVTRRFDRSKLGSALSGVRCDLLFVDSPIGGANRRQVPYQVAEFVEPRYLMAHDVARDHLNIFEWMLEQGWTLLEYLPSFRGLVFLKRRTGARASPPVQIARWTEPIVQAASRPMPEERQGETYWDAEVSRRDEIIRTFDAELTRRAEIIRNWEVELTRRDEIIRTFDAEVIRRDEIIRTLEAQIASNTAQHETEAGQLRVAQAALERDLSEARAFIVQVRSSRIWRLASVYWRAIGWLTHRSN